MIDAAGPSPGRPAPQSASPPASRSVISEDGRGPQLEVLTGELRERAGAIIAKYPNSRSAIMPLLFLVQSAEGYVTEAGMRDVAQLLGLTPAEVLAAGSFYTMLKKRPQGEYLISVCRNITCTHMGGRKTIRALEEHLGIATGETTGDGKFTLESVECLATCDGAPSAQVNYEDVYHLTEDRAIELADKLARGEEVKSVRGEPIKTAKDISLETALAGVRLPFMEHEARTVGGESPTVDMAPGFRPKEKGEPGEKKGPSAHDTT